MHDALVSTRWLAGALDDPAIRIVDASWHLPGAGRDAAADYAARHIRGAVFLDLGGLADPDTALPMMLPSTARFRQHVENLGIGEDHQIIFYDDSALHSSARAWWMFAQAFGLRNIAILDGGFAKWINEGHPTDARIPAFPPARMSVHHDPAAVCDKALILTTPGIQIADARAPSRFAGSEPEPRPGLAAGHIPGSLNLPYDRLFDADSCWKTGDALRSAFVEAGIDLARPLVTSCGSGTTAAVLSFGAHLLGKDDVSLYDGSWTEWGSDPALPKATGPA